jgi:hypothetical protein
MLLLPIIVATASLPSKSTWPREELSPSTRDPPPPHFKPRVHHSPECLQFGGWHDIAGALTFKGTHHVFQGCPNGMPTSANSGGWSHAISTDLVHWTDRGISPLERNETYAGMRSLQSPCSGFVTLNDAGVPCAGFRQCGSTHGATGLNPHAQAWDVPLEARCATDEGLTTWGPNEYLFQFQFYRALPYDPVRPWVDTDGQWYLAMSTDGCNASYIRTPCALGGQLDLYTAARFNGTWRRVGPLFTTNTTMSDGVPAATIDAEFITSDYIGGLPGDPAGGRSRVVLQNRGGQTFWVGTQARAGAPFVPLWDKRGAVGHYDYGDMTMARTLGAASNQVVPNGRRVLIGWANGPPETSQSLARDLSLSPSYELLQQFVPELQTLRIAPPLLHSSTIGQALPGALQLELVASFTYDPAAPPAEPFGVLVLQSADWSKATSLFVDCSSASAASSAAAAPSCTCGIDASAQSGRRVAAPLMFPPGGAGHVHLHAILDGAIIEIIVNNRTAMTIFAHPTDANATGAMLFGTPAKVLASVEGWALASIDGLDSETSDPR